MVDEIVRGVVADVTDALVGSPGNHLINVCRTEVIPEGERECQRHQQRESHRPTHRDQSSRFRLIAVSPLPCHAPVLHTVPRPTHSDRPTGCGCRLERLSAWDRQTPPWSYGVHIDTPAATRCSWPPRPSHQPARVSDGGPGHSGQPVVWRPTSNGSRDEQGSLHGAGTRDRRSY